MIGRTGFALRGRNPDILTCIANLSNDEVFTPPEFANRMLDTLEQAWAADNGGASIWANSSVRFLDPFTKSGVFPREITKRLIDGLQEDIPDLQTRVDHILARQVFGMGITRLTALLARRSLYCSKHAMGAHSIAKSLHRDEGNVWFERTEHTWVGSKCKFCGAARQAFDRGKGLETPMPSSTQTTSTLGSPSCSEGTCSLTLSSAIRHISLPTMGLAQAQPRFISTL
jgi:site-specific DNA-methyltransferase (adenine-specific)